MTDDEYFWEPVPGCWSVRPRAAATTRMAAGQGDLVIDFEFPEPTPTPVTFTQRFGASSARAPSD
jgi:hypothetical protein